MENADTMTQMDDSASLGRFIRESRLKKGMSLGQLAASIGRSSSSVRRWERDEVAPAITVMPALADALGVDLGDLEAKRPSPTDIDDSGPHTAGGDARPPTLEQPVVAPAGESATDSSLQDAASVGLFGDMWNTLFANKDSWIGWVRGIATTVALIVMVIILWWAVGELWDGLLEIWDSFGAGEATP